MADIDTKQSIRLRSFLFAAASYLVGYFVLVVSYGLGMVGVQTLLLLILPFVLPNIAFYIVFRSGFNLRFKDPSLTIEQIVVSTLVIMYTIYLADRVRALILMFYLILFLFGLLRLNTRQLLAIGCYALASYAAVIALVVQMKPDRVNLRMEILQGLVLGLGLIWFAVVGGYISNLRNKVRQQVKLIQQMAIHDELTGVFNRRHLNELLEAERARGERGDTFAVAIVDIDHFKRVNDSLGHLKGDEVLKNFAAQAIGCLRSIDRFGRYGGEEFLLIMPSTTITEARIVAERMRRMAEELVFPGTDETFSITLSIGLAQYRTSENLKDLLARADAALYRAKRDGRNRVQEEGPLTTSV